MPFIFVDRRKAGKGKSTPNRQKLIRRVRDFVKNATPSQIGGAASGGVRGAASNKTANNPIKVAGAALEEPWFVYARGGDNVTVYPGNEEFDRGDEIEIPDEEEGQGGGRGDNGEDEFVVNVASSEFFNEFFGDCELPNLENEKLTEKLDTKQQPAGFSTSGNPAQLSVIRSYKQSLGRRWAILNPYKRELEELEEEFESLMEDLAELESGGTGSGSGLEEKIHARLSEIEDRMIVLRRKINTLDSFDKVDLRFKKKEHKPLHTVDAVLFLVMDISGSMDETKKRIARRWFALLFAFISKRYPGTQLRFIAHTEEAFEMSEADFFSTRINGGTMVSPALKMVNTIIKSDYDPAQTNIYVSHASDGDNWYTDEAAVVNEMVGEGHLINKLQYFNYVEVGKGNGGWAYNSLSGLSQANSTSLWDAYENVQSKAGIERMSMVVLESADDCYSVFKKVFKKK